MLDIGMQLKHPDMIEFLESFELPVFYHFDRIDEGQEDSYSVRCDEPALELLFDAAQVCRTFFIRDPDGVEDEALVPFPNLKSRSQVEDYAQREGIEVVRGAAYIRLDMPDRSVHYEFAGEALSMITVMSVFATPGRESESPS